MTNTQNKLIVLLIANKIIKAVIFLYKSIIWMLLFYPLIDAIRRKVEVHCGVKNDAYLQLIKRYVDNVILFEYALFYNKETMRVFVQQYKGNLT